MKRFLLVLLIFFTQSISGLSPQLPVTGQPDPGKAAFRSSCGNSTESLLSFQPSALFGKKIQSVVVQDHFSFSVVEQPVYNPGYISEQENTVTRFQTADKYGSTGFLAHNYLAGADFLDLKVGDRIDLMIEDEKAQSFWIFSIRKFQALSPCSAYSDFVDLESGQRYTASELFLNFYGQDDLVILQTCLEKNGVLNWGRVFILAYPASAQFFRPWPTTYDTYLPVIQTVE